MTTPATGPEKAPTFTVPELMELAEAADVTADAAAVAGRYADMQAAQQSAMQLKARMAARAREDAINARLAAESPAKKALRANLLEYQPPKHKEKKEEIELRVKAREAMTFDAVQEHVCMVAAALREKGLSPENAASKHARTYIIQTPRLLASKVASGILEIGWRDAGAPNDDSKPSIADRFRNWVEGRSKPEPISRSVWLTDTKGQLGSSNPMSRTHDMVRGCGFDADGKIFIIDSVNVADRSKASEGSGNRLRSVVDPYTYLVDHGFDTTEVSIPSPFSMMRSHVEGVGTPGDDIEGKGYLAFYDHFVARANKLYEGLTGESFQGMSSTEPTVGEAAINAYPYIVAAASEGEASAPKAP